MIANRPDGNRLLGWYRGKVLRHEKFGKCKIYVYGVYPDTCENDPDTVPDAEQLSPIFAGSVDGNGVFTYPYIGATVVCGFLNGDQNFPFYIGTTLGGPEAEERYKDAAPFGAFTHNIHLKNTDITLKDTGDVKITTINPSSGKKTMFNMTDGGNILISADTNITLHSAGTIDINADVQLNVKAPIINVKNATQTTIDSQQTEVTGGFFSVKTGSASIITPVGTIIQTSSTTETF